MKKLFLLLHAFILVCVAQSQQSLNIIPEPVSVTVGQGRYPLGSSLVIGGDLAREEVMKTAQHLAGKLQATSGKTITINPADAAAAIRLLLIPTLDAEIGKEGYRLEVTANGVVIKANQPAGLFYGVQTLIQLLPPAVEGKSLDAGADWSVPQVSIVDYPRFGWRGFMFDVSRHFFTKEEVKSYIDQMVKYKLNLLHLHLTDDEGWRIEIKSLPKLTSVGAWRAYRIGRFGDMTKPTPDEPKDYGGFYTQEDLKELIRYAQDRFVNILPEVDVPGHSLAAVVAYPELSCTPDAKNYQVRSGEKIMEWPPSGHFYGLIDNTLCPANEKVYEFLDKIFTELAAVFPFEYIHMGGDETARNFWEKMPEIKALMKRENLKNLDEVQSYFVKRVEKIVASKGKKLIGWDEILQGGLAPNAAVMSWRGTKGGIEAAKLKHEVVMSPTTHVYIDYMQGDRIIEPPVYASLRLKKVYEFDPLPAGVESQYILGGQANLWTEQVYNMRHAEYMTWPRGLALAEDVWSPVSRKNWSGFVPKVEAHFKRFDAAEKKYARSMYEPDFKFSTNAKGEIVVQMDTEVEGLNIHYSLDYSFPDQYYPIYTKPLALPKDVTLLKVVTYRGKEQMGRIIFFPVEEMKKRLGRN